MLLCHIQNGLISRCVRIFQILILIHPWEEEREGEGEEEARPDEHVDVDVPLDRPVGPVRARAGPPGQHQDVRVTEPGGGGGGRGEEAAGGPTERGGGGGEKENL